MKSERIPCAYCAYYTMYSVCTPCKDLYDANCSPRNSNRIYRKLREEEVYKWGIVYIVMLLRLILYVWIVGILRILESPRWRRTKGLDMVSRLNMHGCYYCRFPTKDFACINCKDLVMIRKRPIDTYFDFKALRRMGWLGDKRTPPW